jgi:hypothetical protein
MEREENDFAFKVTDDDVVLTITIGEGQLGTSFVFRDGVLLVKGGVVIGSLNLGAGADLVGKEVTVDSIVNDISAHTNRMSVRYVVENDGKKKSQLATHEVESEGAICRFVSTLSFRAAT